MKKVANHPGFAAVQKKIAAKQGVSEAPSSQAIWTDLDGRRDSPHALWERRACGDAQAREALIRQYAHLVKITAGRFIVLSSLPSSVDRDDLISAGCCGLLRAVDTYEVGRVKFETYAIALIRGAMLEMLRSEDWVPRLVRDQAKEIRRVSVALEGRLGHPGSEPEIAAAIGIAEGELERRRALIARCHVLSLDGIACVDGGATLQNLLPSEEPSPEIEALRRARRELLAAEIERLPQRERLVMALYYKEGLTFREVGAAMDGISESRAYQLHQQAVKRIRLALGADGRELCLCG